MNRRSFFKRLGTVAAVAAVAPKIAASVPSVPHREMAEEWTVPDDAYFRYMAQQLARAARLSEERMVASVFNNSL